MPVWPVGGAQARSGRGPAGIEPGSTGFELSTESPALKPDLSRGDQRRGWDVRYLSASCPASPLTSPHRRPRRLPVWPVGGAQARSGRGPAGIEPGSTGFELLPPPRRLRRLHRRTRCRRWRRAGRVGAGPAGSAVTALAAGPADTGVAVVPIMPPVPPVPAAPPAPPAPAAPPVPPSPYRRPAGSAGSTGEPGAAGGAGLVASAPAPPAPPGHTARIGPLAGGFAHPRFCAHPRLPFGRQAGSPTRRGHQDAYRAGTSTLSSYCLTRSSTTVCHEASSTQRRLAVSTSRSYRTNRAVSRRVCPSPVLRPPAPTLR